MESDISLVEHQLFITSIYSSALENVDNTEALAQARAVQSIDSGRRISNYGGWQSHDLGQEMYEQFSELDKIRTGTQKAVELIAKKWGYAARIPFMVASWVNINQSGDFNWAHVHPWSQFSAVYYINFNDNSGDIVFIRGDDSEDYMPPNKSYNKYLTSRSAFRPKPGTLYIFPSHLEHLVNRNESKEERVSMAFNFAL